jgi:hypothetical protein
MKKTRASQGQSASALISQRIDDLADWRGETLGRMRKLIQEAVPDVIEEWKWMGTPIWSSDGMICTGESYKKIVKLTFLKGAALKDPARLFNAGLDGNARRVIDIQEGEKVDATAFKALVRQAAAFNRAGKAKSATKVKSASKAKSATKVNSASKAKSADSGKSAGKVKRASKVKSTSKGKSAGKTRSAKNSKG